MFLTHSHSKINLNSGKKKKKKKRLSVIMINTYIVMNINRIKEYICNKIIKYDCLQWKLTLLK